MEDFTLYRLIMKKILMPCVLYMEKGMSGVIAEAGGSPFGH